MTALPKRRISTHRRGKRRRGQARVKNILPTLVKCPHCGKLKPPHQACPHCGFYQERQVFQVKTDKENKKTKK